jgi:hypothetical protein
MFKKLGIGLLVFGIFNFMVRSVAFAAGNEGGPSGKKALEQWRTEVTSEFGLAPNTRFLFVDPLGPVSGQPSHPQQVSPAGPVFNPTAAELLGWNPSRQNAPAQNQQSANPALLAAENARRAAAKLAAEKAAAEEAARQAAIREENQARENLAHVAYCQAESEIRISRAQAELQEQWEPIRRKAQESKDATINGMREDTRRMAQETAEAEVRNAATKEMLASLLRNKGQASGIPTLDPHALSRLMIKTDAGASGVHTRDPAFLPAVPAAAALVEVAPAVAAMLQGAAAGAAFTGSAAGLGYALHKITKTQDEAGPSEVKEAVEPSKVVQDFLGDTAEVKINKNGDRIFISADGQRKVRFDIEHSHSDKPHMHKVRNDHTIIWGNRYYLITAKFSYSLAKRKNEYFLPNFCLTI